MVKAKMYRKIQQLKRSGKSKRAIANELSIDQKTVKKYFDMNEDDYQQQLSDALERTKLFDSYRDEILNIYELNEHDKLNMCSVYDYLEEKHTTLPGTEKSLRNYINYLINSGTLTIKTTSRNYQQVTAFTSANILFCRALASQFQTPLICCALLANYPMVGVHLFQVHPFYKKKIIQERMIFFLRSNGLAFQSSASCRLLPGRLRS